MVPFVIVGLGQLGREFAAHFVRHGIEFTSYDLPNVDVTKPETLEIIAKDRPQVIFNCSAYTNVDGAETNQDLATAVNQTGVRNLAKLAKRIGATLVHFSTDYIFDGESNFSYGVNSKARPLNFYGQSKLFGELELIESGADYLIVRTSTLYGNTGPNFVLNVLSWATKTNRLRGVTDQVSAPTHTEDLVVGTLALLNAGSHGVYHLTNSGSCSKYDLMKEIVRLWELDAEVVPALASEFPTPARRPRHSVLSLQKTLPHFQPRSWQDALARYRQSV